MELYNKKASTLIKLLIIIVIIIILVVAGVLFYNTKNDIVPTNVMINPVSLILNIDETKQFTTTILPTNSSQSVTWSIDNKTIGTINESGLFRAIAPGKVIVTATSTVDSSIFGTASITIIKAPAIERTPSSFDITLKQGGIVDLTIRIKNTGGETLRWTKSTNVDWITGLPKEGTSVGEWDSTTITINATNLKAGVHKGIITFSAVGVNFQTIPITLMVE